MDKNKFDISMYETGVKDFVETKKVKKFFAITTPILVLEIIAIIILSVFFITLPKNYCKVDININNAEIYINDKKTTKFRFSDPKNESNYYYYGVDVSVYLPENVDYNIKFTVNCDKYTTRATSDAVLTDDIYYLQARGGQKVKILSAIVIISSGKISDFDVNIKIDAEKI